MNKVIKLAILTAPSEVLKAATAEANHRYCSRLIEDYDGDRYDEDEYGYDATARQAFVAGALWQARSLADTDEGNEQ